MAASNLTKFDKSNPEHVKAIKGEDKDGFTSGGKDVKIHAGGYFSKTSPSKNPTSDGGKKAVAKKVATPRKLKAVPMAETPATAKKAPAKKAAPKKK